MTKLISAPARRVRPALSDKTARKITDLAREITPDTDPVIVENITRRACRAIGIPFSDVAGQRFGAFAAAQRDWDARIDRVLSRDLATPLPDGSAPTHELLNVAASALTAFLDSDKAVEIKAQRESLRRFLEGGA